MGSSTALDVNPDLTSSAINGHLPSGMTYNTRGKQKAIPSDFHKRNTDKVSGNEPKEKKRKMPGSSKPAGSRNMPKRAAASSNMKEQSDSFSEKSDVIETKRDPLVEDETVAVNMTSGPDDPRPNRRLTDFILHDADGNPQPFEMSEVDDLFISGTVLHWEGTPDKDKDKGVRCEGFGRIETWAISGYEEGSPVIWVSTDVADYDCVKPASNYRKFYDHFLWKARCCIQVFQKLSKSSGGNPDLNFDELIAGVVRSMSGSKSFPNGTSIKDFVISQGEFIYNQLIGLEESQKDDTKFSDLPVLVALRDESRKKGDFLPSYAPSDGSLKIRDESAKLDESVTSSGVGDEDEDAKLARLLQEEEYWTSMKSKKGHRPATGSNKYYIKINENEIANDYPLPAYYKTSAEEMDEYVVLDNDIDVYDSDSLPRMMLHNWSLYNSDSRLISLELLPMKPCAEVDVTAYGSGIMTADDGSGFCLDTDPKESSSSVSGAQHAGGIPIYLSAIKEWMIEFGSSMVFISIRTDLAWYRLGKPSKQYAPWYETVLKTARLSIGIITLLKEQSRVARLSFADVVKKLLEFKKDHPAYISSNPAVLERYVVVHGQIILQQFAEYPDEQIKKCAFVTGLSIKMEERQHTKLEVKKKAVIKQETNLNPRAAMGPLVSKRKAMEATTTRLINRIWGEYYSNYSPDDMNVDNIDPKEEEVDEEQEENEEDDDEEVEEEKVSVPEKVTPKAPSFSQTKCKSNIKQIEWDGGPVGTTCSSEPLYRQAVIRGEVIAVASAVFLEVDDSEEMLPIYFVEYMFETSDARKMIHGRLLKRGSQTVLGNTANEREVFLTNECMEFELGDVKKSVVLDVRKISWGHQHRKDDINFEKNDRARAEDRKRRDLPMEYYCKSLYWPERGAFFKLPYENMGLGTGVCHSCKIKETERENEIFVVNSSKSTITYKGLQYKIHDFVYVSPHHFGNNAEDQGTFKGGRNVGLKAYVVCQLLGFDVPSISKKPDPKSAKVKVRRFFRPEDASLEKAYSSDIREVYYSEQKLTLPVEVIEGRCEVRRKIDVPPSHGLAIFEHIFFCEHLYEPDTGAVKRLPTSIRLDSSKVDESTSRKRKGKGKEGESDPGVLDKQVDASQKSRLATLDIFAGCGGLSEGLEKSGVSETKWAIEYEEPAGEAFRLNHPEALTLINNCNVILRAIMERCGDADECISTSEAAELSKQLGDEINNLPLPGQVDFINGGPPCQGFSGMNRFNQSTWSKVQCEMILAFLSFADYFRPRFFLLENVRNFVSFNKGQTFRLTLASLLEIGYQVRFGILEAGAYGVAQSRKRAFIWAASPEETLPEWPEPMHVFAGPELKISLTGNSQFAAVRSTGNGAPFRAITVKDTIGDLPSVGNGASKAMMDYGGEPVSWFQKKIRGDMTILHDHISKEMNELNLIRCQRIPRRPGSDWRDLPEEKVRLSTGQLVDLIPWCLPNTAKRHNQWKGLFGRLDWEGNFPTSITDPQPMGKVGMCFHPEQDRIVTVRECARSQGFPDGYKFAGTIQHKHRQIGNAVPPPLAFAMGRKLKEVLNKEEM